MYRVCDLQGSSFVIHNYCFVGQIGTVGTVTGGGGPLNDAVSVDQHRSVDIGTGGGRARGWSWLGGRHPRASAVHSIAPNLVEVPVETAREEATSVESNRSGTVVAHSISTLFGKVHLNKAMAQD